MTFGIYTITSPSGRVYVGQSVDIERRFAEYQRNGSVKKQRRIAASFAKYGVNAHEFSLLVECSEVDLFKLEREWQDRLDVRGKTGLNCRMVADLDKVGRFSDESRHRMSERQSGTGNPNFGKRGVETSCFGRTRHQHERDAIRAYQQTRGRLILQIDPNTGAVLRKAKCREYAADGYSQGNISSCCNGRLKTYKGFKFQYEEQAQ